MKLHGCTRDDQGSRSLSTLAPSTTSSQRPKRLMSRESHVEPAESSPAKRRPVQVSPERPVRTHQSSPPPRLPVLSFRWRRAVWALV